MCVKLKPVEEMNICNVHKNNKALHCACILCVHMYVHVLISLCLQSKRRLSET